MDNAKASWALDGGQVSDGQRDDMVLVVMGIYGVVLSWRIHIS